MLSSVLLIFGALAAVGMYRYVSSLRKQIERAKSTGLKYYILPVTPITPYGQAFAIIWVPLMKLLWPKSYWEDIEDICWPNWLYSRSYKAFAKAHTETLVIATPSILLMHTVDPSFTHEVSSRREAFPKPTEHYKILQSFGTNVLTTEGQVWRLHRKITSSSFNEKNAALIFRESIEQTQGMMAYWLEKQKKGIIKSVEHDTMTLALNIISYAGFGLRLIWPDQALPADADPKSIKYASVDPVAGHSLTFPESIERTLKYLLTILVCPCILLDNLPIEHFKKTKEARDNYSQYMREFIAEKAADIRSGDHQPGMDLMGSLVSTLYGDDEGKKKSGIKLSDEEIIGNAFIMFVAGHETTANTMHFSILELANNPAVQRQVQQDVDRILGRDSDPAKWDYDEKLNAMQASMLGAVMNETLRLMPPVVEVPKKTTPTQEQSVTIDGVKRTLPPNTYIGLSMAATHRNPRVWPTKPSKITGESTDLDDWVPERWFRASMSVAEKKSETFVEDTEDYGGYAGPDTSASMYRPVRGSYIPFSDGARSCLGRRMAIVEVLAAFAVIFQKYSIENDVSDWASDEEVARMTDEEKSELYAKAVKRSRDVMGTAETRITLKLYNGSFVPLRLVKRGEERFVNCVDL
ncbi:cytochrome P450 [Xylariaceae sp. FL0255]|nr:cytochrome P450 [Xylariaceae sp. FL0255]